MECQREKTAAGYPERDPERERQRLAIWRAANREKVNAKSRARGATSERKAYSAEWHAKNRDRRLEQRRGEYPEKWRAKNIASAAAWKAANPDKAREHGRMSRRNRRARAREAGGSHTAADLADILKAQGNRCAYCRADLRKTKKHVDHIKPLAGGGSNGRANLQYLCQPCNQAKNRKDPIDYAQSIGLLL